MWGHIEGVKISSYIESWTLQDPRSSIKCDYGQEYQISSGINESSYTDATKQQKHQAAMIQGLVQVAYFSGQRVNMCVTDFPRNNTVWLMEIFKYKRLSQFKGITMKAIKKTVQGVVIAISMLVASQSAFVGASDTLRRLCSIAAGGRLVEDMKITGYTQKVGLHMILELTLQIMMAGCTRYNTELLIIHINNIKW